MSVEVGSILDGKVTGLTNFGAFITLPGNITGMVHISEVSNTYVKEIREYLSEGQEVKVKVLSVSPDGKISLSIKQAAPAPQPQERPAFSHPRPRPSRPNTWQGQQASSEPATFEDMMAKFKQVSDDKFSDLRRSNDSRYSQSSSRRGSRK
ncbi:MAG TPA: RNA-binding protein S1 [Ruminococcaceae bacterium]|nr:RNA-binding protein S1 [Oscillospiraceae bacterium]